MCYAGLKNGKDGYEGLIEAALAISGLFKVDQQWQTVATALERAFPSYILTMASIFMLLACIDNVHYVGQIKVMMPPSRFSREYFAAFTTIFFPWLVGPCEV